MGMDLDLRVAADCHEAEGAVQYSSDAVRMRFFEFCDDGTTFPHINAAVELPGYSLARWEKRDAQDLLCRAHFAKEAVGSLQSFPVPKFGVLVSHGHELVAGGVGVEAARVHVGHVGVSLAQGDSGTPVIEHCDRQTSHDEAQTMTASMPAVCESSRPTLMRNRPSRVKSSCMTPRLQRA
jgi:hypothetical protein